MGNISGYGLSSSVCSTHSVFTQSLLYLASVAVQLNLDDICKQTFYEALSLMALVQ